MPALVNKHGDYWCVAKTAICREACREAVLLKKRPCFSLIVTEVSWNMEGGKVQNTRTVRTEVGAVGELTRGWQSWSDDRADYQRLNPFSSDKPITLRMERGDPTYGRPLEGSKTEQRGKDAHTNIGKEVEELCLVIRSAGEKGQDGHVRIAFKQLFDRYVTISNKVVGILLRARKHGLVDFKGEMLWQGKDDHVVITLLE